MDALTLAVSAIAYGNVRPEPRVNVRWSYGGGRPRRATLEAQFHLTQGELKEGRTWSYRIADTTSTNVETLVTHPSVEDSPGIDRNVYTVDGAPGRFDGLGLALLLGFGTSTLAYIGVAAVRRLPLGHFQQAPLAVRVLAVFSIAYVLFFVYPVFLNSDHAMASEADFPAGSPADGIGMDARLTIAFSRAWLEHGLHTLRANLILP